MKKTTISFGFIFPFDKISRGESIILYGYGIMGQSYLAQILATSWCSIAQVLDAGNPDVMCNYPIIVEKPTALRYHGEKVLVAISNEKMRYKVVLWLKEQGIDAAHIINLPARELIMPVSSTVHRIVKRGDELLPLKRDLLEELHAQLLLYAVPNYIQFVRVGNSHDGGYVMAESVGEKIAYSFGIANDVSWDSDMVNSGFTIYMYDPTIDDLPLSSDMFHFSRIGITGNKESDKMKHLSTLLHSNDHEKENHMVLKVDVEGAEWDFLNEVSEKTLEKFDQILFEFHGLLDFWSLPEKIKCLKKLNKTHRLIHVHANNYADVLEYDGRSYPDTIEATYIHNNLISCNLAKVKLPRKEDAQNTERLREIQLGDWNKER